jgi:UDP-2,3-diacylglucosamine pyrophosphatase LpxH
MSVLSKPYNPSKYFSYQRGKITTETPWNPPTYPKVKQFLLEIQNTSDIMKDYDLYLVGDILWGFNTDDVSIIMIGNPTSYIVLEDYMHYMYDIALNKYNISIDINWVNTKPEDITYTPNFDFSYDNDFLRIGYVKTQIGEKQEELDLRNNPSFLVQGDYLVKGNFKNINFKESFINKIKNTSNSPLKMTFSVEEFLENDEEYFIKNTNKLQYL